MVSARPHDWSAVSVAYQSGSSMGAEQTVIILLFLLLVRSENVVCIASFKFR